MAENLILAIWRQILQGEVLAETFSWEPKWYLKQSMYINFQSLTPLMAFCAPEETPY